ncbi:MAG TPA: VCBS repeat-containing protein [Candidatus Hydrogenedentes bacterium]|nr:VCBS repeat-containing protein [Candidatus Hydrogenedentota bacterium]
MLATLATALLIAVFEPPLHLVLDTNTSIWDVTVTDINSDGFKDVFAVCCDEMSHPLRKSVACYLAASDATYPPRPSFALDLDPSIGALFFAEIDGAPPHELIAMNAAQATVYRYGDGRFEEEKTCAFPSLIPTGSREPAFLEKAARDFDGDGIDEWLIPASNGYEVRNIDGLIAQVSCDVVSEIDSGTTVYITHRLPQYHLFDREGTNLKGIAFLSDEYADFAYGPKWSEHSRFKIPLNLEEKWEAQTGMGDINKDGLPDLVVTQTKGTINIQVLTQVYIAKAPFTYSDTPDITYETRGAVAMPALKDVDGDEDLDILFISIPFGVKTIVNYFVRRKLAVRVDVYVFDGKAFPQDPSFETTMLLDAPEGREQVAHTLGDFNGDGRLDIAFGAGAEKLSVLTGSEKRFVSSKPWQTVETPSFGDARAHDLNGDGRDDIVLFHPTGENRRRIEVILF